jgi:hypothetical protein
LHCEHVPAGCSEGAPEVVRLQRAQQAAEGGEQAALTPVMSATGVVIVAASAYTNFGRSRVENVVLPPPTNSTVPPTGSVLE